MKNVRAIFILLMATFFLFSAGCGDSGSFEPSGGKNQEEINELNNKVSELEKENQSLKKESQKLKKERDDAEAKARERYITLSIIAYTVLGFALLLIGGFVFIVRAAKHAPAKMSNDSLHCPRCGWEHGPDETVCKNCKTRF